MVLEAVGKTVTKKFEGENGISVEDLFRQLSSIRWRQSALEDLIEKLRRLGYYETSGELRTKGEYRMLRSSGSIEIFLHDFDFPTEKVKGVPVRISLQGNSVTRIENLATGQEMFSLELEPELVTGLYERIWQERRVVKLAEVPPLLVKAILAVEDERFYRHIGVDPIGILRAMWVNLRHLSYQQGGSTLTQQLMKNFFLSDERTLSRKIPEAVMALIAERKYSKETILENYLNEIYLGSEARKEYSGSGKRRNFISPSRCRNSPSVKPRCLQV